MCRLSAGLMSMGSSFNHSGDRTANSHDFVEWVGVPLREQQADWQMQSGVDRLGCKV